MIFRDDFDREAFLRQLTMVCQALSLAIRRLLPDGQSLPPGVQTLEPNLGDGMRELNGLMRAGLQRARTASTVTLFKPRYYAQLVQDERLLLAATRYVTLNPYRAGLVDRPERWRWSSYAGLVTGADPAMVDPRPVLELIHDDPWSPAGGSPRW